MPSGGEVGKLHLNVEMHTSWNDSESKEHDSIRQFSHLSYLMDSGQLVPPISKQLR